MREDNGVFLFLQRVNSMNERGIGRPFEFRDKVGDFGVKVIDGRFDVVRIFETALGRGWDSANAILNFEGLANPAAIFPIDEFLTHARNPFE